MPDTPISQLEQARLNKEEGKKEFERRLEQIIDYYATTNRLEKIKALNEAANIIKKLSDKYKG